MGAQDHQVGVPSLMELGKARVVVAGLSGVQRGGGLERPQRAGDPAPTLDGGRVVEGVEHYLRHDLPRDQLATGHFTLDQVAAHHVTQTITATLLDEDIAAALDATPGAAALVITRTHRDDRARLVSVGVHTHPADRFQITTTISQPDRSR